MIMVKRTLAAAALTLALTPVWATGALSAPKVVASIKPVHSLAALVMQGVGEPELIVGGAGSPHAYALKPSQAQSLEDADLIFWIGPELETFLKKPIETIGGGARAVALSDADGMIKLKFREAGPFEAHEHGEEHEEHHADTDGHAHDGEGKHTDGHAHEADHKHEDGDHKHDAAEEAGHDHHHSEFDGHIWLDPVNAKLMLKAIGEALAQADPVNAAAYARNVRAGEEKLDILISEVDTLLSPARGKGFIVFHDAYQYFEKRFDIEAAGSVTVNPEVKPSAERVALIRDKVRELNAVCAFAEPQFESRLIDVVIEGTDAKTAVLDPLGSGLEDGPELYFQLIRGMARSMQQCLGGA